LVTTREGWEVHRFLGHSQGGWEVHRLLGNNQGGWEVHRLLGHNQGGWEVHRLLGQNQKSPSPHVFYMVHATSDTCDPVSKKILENTFHTCGGRWGDGGGRARTTKQSQY